MKVVVAINLTGEPRLCPISCTKISLVTWIGRDLSWFEKDTKPVFLLCPPVGELVSTANLEQTPPSSTENDSIK